MNRDYPYIKAWHYLTGSYPFYVENLVNLAKHEKAPENAIFKHEDGTWATIKDCKNPDMVAACRNWLQFRGYKVPLIP